MTFAAPALDAQLAALRDLAAELSIASSEPALLERAREEVERAAESFADWESIRGENIAQDYLVSLLIKPRG